MLNQQLRALQRATEDGGAVANLPAHLADVPACLHKYEPLLRPAAVARGAASVSQAG
ncbi:MAG TPA: hypothetical protein VNT32_01690 [Thermoleophilaceae bacterium]|nr:hypothetical protein [Thermoleophilaceae bacterium]